jgi:hypothetical protein
MGAAGTGMDQWQHHEKEKPTVSKRYIPAYGKRADASYFDPSNLRHHALKNDRGFRGKLLPSPPNKFILPSSMAKLPL